MNLDDSFSIVLLALTGLLSSALLSILTAARPGRIENEKVVALLQQTEIYISMQAIQTGLQIWLAVAFLNLTRGLPGWHNWQLALLWLSVVTLWLGVDFWMRSRLTEYADRIIEPVLPLVRLFALPFWPLGWVLVRLLGAGRLPTFQSVMTAEDFRDWVESESEESDLQPEERRMIHSIFEFGETLAREIMVPRIDVVALPVDVSLDEAVRVFIESGHSRLPVYEDVIDNVVGLLYAKDLLPILQQQGDTVQLKKLLRPAYFVPETKKVDDLLAEMQAQRIHMAVVVDEYGAFAGLVTLEDIVEEIVGEILDEFDKGEDVLIEPVNENEYLFAGHISLDDFNEIMNLALEDNEADTLAGFLYDLLGRVPEEGTTLTAQGVEFRVEQVSGRRILRIRARRIPVTQDEKGNPHA